MNNGRGIYVDNSNQSLRLIGNYISNITGESIRYEGSGNEGNAWIANNIIKVGSGSYGAALSGRYASEIWLLENKIEPLDSLQSYGEGPPTGINITDVEQVEVRGQQVTNLGTGITISESDYALVRGNDLRGNRYGIYVWRTSALVDSNMVVGNQYDGIRINTDFETLLLIRYAIIPLRAMVRMG